MKSINEIVEWSQGNPGALTFLMELMNPINDLASQIIFPVLDKLEKTRGTNLYVLWSDICERDIVKVAEVVTVCSNEMVEDACDRQDYSGRKIIDDYLKSLIKD